MKLSLMVSCFSKTDSTANDEIERKMVLKVTSNSCGILICFIGSKKLFIRSKLSVNDGRILILDVDIDDKDLILINLYHPNTKVEQLKTLSKLTEILTKLHLTKNNTIICAVDFNLIFNIKLESSRRNPVFKNALSEKYMNRKKHTI